MIDDEAGSVNAVPLMEECKRAMRDVILKSLQPSYMDRTVIALVQVLSRRGLLTLEGVQALQLMKEEK